MKTEHKSEQCRACVAIGLKDELVPEVERDLFQAGELCSECEERYLLRCAMEARQR